MKGNALEIAISTRHGNLQADTQERIKSKVEKLPRYYDRITGIDVTVDMSDHNNPSVEILVSAEGIDNVVASGSGSNVISSVDDVMHKIERQLKKSKQKMQSHSNETIRQMEEDSPE